jgi:hypothetical protein
MTDLGELEPFLNVELGGGIAADSQPVGTLDRINLLRAGVEAFNAEAPMIFTLTGVKLDRDAMSVERRLIVLFSAWAWVRGRALDMSTQAIVHSNVAGRTDITGIELGLAKRAKEWRDEINALLPRLLEPAIMGDIHAEELGETRNITLNPTPPPSLFPWIW